MGEEYHRKLFQERTVKALGKSCTTRGFKYDAENTKRGAIKMFIVGHVSSSEEAAEIEFIAKSFVVAHRVKTLAHTLTKE